MNSRVIEGIADAVLYEGYMLYPYRPSAVKNRQRWNFGVVYPKFYSEQQKGVDAWFTQTECLIRVDDTASVGVTVRFLHSVSRLVGKCLATGAEATAGWEIVDALEVDGKVLRPWQEAVECDVAIASLSVSGLLANSFSHLFALPARCDTEDVRDDKGRVVAQIIRSREAIEGCVEVRAVRRGDKLFKLTVRISNLTAVELGVLSISREEALPKSLLSAHAVLRVSGGDFISLMDPPAGLEGIVSECKNVGTWPVLVGDEGTKDAMLAAPIILYDYPQIAPESAGNVFDGTEIDEILALRILTLSDEEKIEIRETGERAREVLERTESMPPEQFLKLHGVLRGMKPVDETPADSVHNKDQI